MWRIWQKGKATLHELETHWSILDIYKANILLDLEEDRAAEIDNEILSRNEKK